jgi:hypothetical protein
MRLTSIHNVILLCDVSNYASFRSVEIVITTTYLRLSFCTLYQFLLCEINEAHERKTKQPRTLMLSRLCVLFENVRRNHEEQRKPSSSNFRCLVLHVNN